MKLERKITISVLLTVYNTEFSLVKRAIDSVLKQDFQFFELIVIDDGSDKNLQDELIKYIKIHEHKIIYVRHKNCGQSKSINRGIKNCSGEYIAIIDADDEYKPNHLSACLKEMENLDLISSYTETIVNKPEDYYVPDKYDPRKRIHVDDCILFATLFGKKEVFTAFKFRNTYAADSIFYDTAAQHYRVKKVNLKTYIYYRSVPNSICEQMKRKNA